ncbi:MAG TPA: M23 family metallopeptidase [Chloroflexota bacterium]|nr:M23 family metallopeptidase [Chloroflexota bacterium]
MRLVAPLAGWNVRGYSYGELQPDGQRHPGADLNVGYGDDDLGLPVLCFADGIVVERREWDGQSCGLGNVALVAHHLFAGPSAGLHLWSAYAHLDSFAPSFVKGTLVGAGEPIGTCGKSGHQQWAHLHFELRYKGPPDMTALYWGGRLSYEAQSDRYADPYTVLRVLEGAALGPAESDSTARLEELRRTLQLTEEDRERNYRLKMELESQLRSLETARRVKRGTTDSLIRRVFSQPAV